MTDHTDSTCAPGASDIMSQNFAAAVRTPPFLAHPTDILDDPALTMEQKRLILASWLSDRHAVPDAPRWRQLENGAFVDAYEVEQALCALDETNGKGGAAAIEPDLRHISGASPIWEMGRLPT
jgi:hypothetical protein